MQYNEWLKKVDAILLANCGMTHEDLPDVCYRDWFDDEMSPLEADKLAFEYANE